jgi:hypothetical protein
VRGAPDQPERQRRQILDGDQNNVVADEHRYASRRRPDDLATSDQGDELMDAAGWLGTADEAAGGRTRRGNGVIQGGRERRRHLGHRTIGEVFYRHRWPGGQRITGGHGEDPIPLLQDQSC